jgi:hypothetical protein
MTQVEPDVPLIELGVPGTGDQVPGPSHAPVHQRRRFLTVLLVLICVLAVTASSPGRPGLDSPLWTGSVSLNGAIVGTSNLYMWRLDGKAVIAVDVVSGKPRWSRDITDLPDSVTDLGNGVVVVSTRRSVIDGTGPLSNPIALVRADSGELIAATVGDFYQASADGRVLLVFSRRVDNPDSCMTIENSCTDITAWDVQTGTVAWRLSLPLNANFTVDGHVNVLGELDADGTVRFRDAATGAVTGTVHPSPDVLRSLGEQTLIIGDRVLTGQRGPDGITVTAYAQPSLNRLWSTVIPDFTAVNNQGAGYLYLWECGSDACLTVTGASTWVMNQSTGAVRRPIALQVVQRVGDGVFLASPQTSQSISDSPTGPMHGFIVDPNGKIQAAVSANAVVDWSDNGDRALIALEGQQRTEFQVIDERGIVRSLGSVSGTNLTCHARADFLACADPRGALRVWRLPV